MSTIRVTNLGTSESMLGYITTSSSKYNKLAEEASSNYKVTKPSDDPEATGSLLDINTQLEKLSGYLSNIKSSQTELSSLDSNLSSVTDLIQSATDLATEAANGTYSNTDMDNIKKQVDQIVNGLIDLANTQYDGKYLYSGAATSTKAYTTTTDVSGNITAITYNGTPSTSDYQRTVTISDGVTVTTNTTGDQVFGSYDSADPTKTKGLFGTLMTLSTALGAHDKTTTNSCLTGLSTALDNTSATRTTFASLSNRFDLTSSSINTTVTNLTAHQSDLQDADLSQVLADLSTQQTALQASYNVFSTVSKMSLLNYM